MEVDICVEVKCDDCGTDLTVRNKEEEGTDVEVKVDACVTCISVACADTLEEAEATMEKEIEKAIESIDLDALLEASGSEAFQHAQVTHAHLSKMYKLGKLSDKLTQDWLAERIRRYYELAKTE